MKLFIDTSDSEKIKVGLGERLVSKMSRQNKSQVLLTTIDQLLKESSASVNDIAEIEVNVSPGSFTGLRVGVAVANIIGFCLGIPVNGQNIEKKGPVEPKYE